MTVALAVRDVRASIGELEILKGVDVEVPFGEIHVIMGPNGSGKSTLSHVLMGKDEYVASGSAIVDGVEVLDLAVDERARQGLFEAFQYPVEIPGVALADLLDEMRDATADQEAFDERVDRYTDQLGMRPFLQRAVNDGLSGGEKKRSEMFQMAVSGARVAVLDEVDSGLDIDAVREVAELVEELRSDDIGILMITHYNRILRYMRPDKVHVMIDGRIVMSGGPDVAAKLEESGYDDIRRELGMAPKKDDTSDDDLLGLL
jgi:Fe-S cluster assembly ATP-binding protein